MWRVLQVLLRQACKRLLAKFWSSLHLENSHLLYTSPRLHLSTSPGLTTSDDDMVCAIHNLLPKSSPLDFFPNSFLKSWADVLGPLITRLANLSLSEGVFPDIFRVGHVMPLLKKPGSDMLDMGNYRPITNLNTIGKLLEDIVQKQHRRHIEASPNFRSIAVSVMRSIFHRNRELWAICLLPLTVGRRLCCCPSTSVRCSTPSIIVGYSIARRTCLVSMASPWSSSPLKSQVVNITSPSAADVHLLWRWVLASPKGQFLGCYFFPCSQHQSERSSCPSESATTSMLMTLSCTQRLAVRQVVWKTSPPVQTL